MSAKHRNRLVFLAVTLVLTLVFFHRLAIGGGILARGDAHDYFYPYWDARNAAFRNGELPLWTDDLFMGIPLLANPQLGVFYPPNWLTAPFRAPAAISVSILLHVALAGLGAGWLYRQAVGGGWLPALGAAIVYAFGGYLGAHVEQINQLQGLAWLPILFALAHRMITRRGPLPSGLVLALAWALQIFSGHTQTVFISGVGLAVYGVALAAMEGAERRDRWRRALRALAMLAAAFIGALLLALPQLLPSQELMSLSNRGGGFSLRDATSFSLSPATLGRSLLPGYDGQLFGEYVAYIGLIGLALALWGGWHARGRKRIWLLLALVGLALALGRYNPAYALLAQLPGFNLFRVPARFLSLVSLALAMLAGMGLQALSQPGESRPWLPALGIGAALALLILLTRFLLLPNPALIFGDSAISPESLLLWCGGLALGVGLLLIRQPWTGYAALALLTLELLLAAQNLPYNDVSPADLYLSQRFTISQLKALQADEIAPGRTLTMTQIRFDPGDIGDLRARFDRLGMDYPSQFHALDAVKKAETLMPNLGLTWGIPTVDGFGGGIAPMASWTAFSAGASPAEPTVDGRLGARLAHLPECSGSCIPPRAWLEASDTRYLITDKIHDVWHEDIAYDITLARFWEGAEALETPDAVYDQARILRSEREAGAIAVREGVWLNVMDWASAGDFLAARDDVLAVTAANSRHPQIFQEQQPPPFERVLSSAIEVYRMGERSERAYLPSRVEIQPDALELKTGGGKGEGSVDVLGHEPGAVRLRVSSPEATYVVLRDAFYPGWAARVNGEAAAVYRADGVFRAVPVPAGESEVALEFAPRLWQVALGLGGLIWLLAALAAWRLWSSGPGAESLV